MHPVIAIVGRPNVGKSTLFNCLTRSRAALVADEPGITRDRQFALARLADRPVVLADTGGLGDARDELSTLVSTQALQAVDESDLALLIVDGREGLTPEDERIGEELRRRGKRTVVVVNKTEGTDPLLAAAEFHELGLGEPVPISASHRRGLDTLEEAVAGRLPEPSASEAGEDDGVRVAIVGRPNAGKSTLVNRLVGETRVIAHDAPGTTRDSIRVPFRRGERDYTLIDTAGIRRRARVHEPVEKFSVLKSLQAIASCDVVILVVDAEHGVTDQDASLLGQVLEAGKALAIAINKWDLVETSDRARVRMALERKLGFVDFARRHFICALDGRGLGALFRSVDRAWASAGARLPTSELNRVLQRCQTHQPPPLVRGRRIKLRFAHQGGTSPPLIIVHGNQTDALPEHYRRYLARAYRSSFELEGTPVVMQFRTGENPYRGRVNRLTPRQRRRRKRLLRHAKRK